MKTQIISIANQKGGVSKTTTCLNLGIGLERAGTNSESRLILRPKTQVLCIIFFHSVQIPEHYPFSRSNHKIDLDVVSRFERKNQKGKEYER